MTSLVLGTKKCNIKFIFNFRDHPELVTGVTNKEEDTRIHACVHYRDSNDHILCLVYHKEKNFLTVRLSAMKWGEYDLEESPIDRVTNNKIYACFPTHCSRSELIYFVNYFSPKTVSGFPEEYKNTVINMKNEPNNQVVVKKPIKRKLNNEDQKINDKIISANILQEIFKI